MDLDVERPRPKPTMLRWVGLFQIAFLNIVITLNWLAYSVVPDKSSTFFGVDFNAINWMSTGFLFAFAVSAPFALWAMRYGPKPPIVIASILLFTGSWIRYIGTTYHKFGVVLFGHIIISLSQPFSFCVSSLYSNVWFSPKARVATTSVTSLSSALGGVIAFFWIPTWAHTPDQIGPLTRNTAILSTAAAVLSILVPSSRRSTTYADSAFAFTRRSVWSDLRALLVNIDFWLIFIIFSIYLGLFNALTSVLSQVFTPYGLSDKDVGYGGAALVLVGIGFTAILSPIIGRYHLHYLTIRTSLPFVGIWTICLIFVSTSKSLAGMYLFLACLGIIAIPSFPVLLELLVELTAPTPPETSSVLVWTGSQVFGGTFVLGMSALTDKKGKWGPAGNLRRALIMQAVIMCAVVPLVFFIGRRRRRAVDVRGAQGVEDSSHVSPDSDVSK